MSHSFGGRLLAVVLTATAALGAPTAAHAERAVTQDPAGDAVLVDTTTEPAPDAEGGQIPSTPAPEFTAVDITRTVVDHRADRLRVTVRFRDLRSTQLHFTAIRVRTPQRRFGIDIERMRGRSQGAATLTGAGGRTVECRGLRWSIDNDTDRVVASLPTSCLDAPRWVQVGVGAISLDSALGSGVEEVFADDGQRADAIRDNLKKGPKVRRG